MHMKMYDACLTW